MNQWITPAEYEQYDEVLDLFCGGGGSGSGILDAHHLLGRNVRATFVNHAEEAIKIHSFNHPLHRHLCTGIDAVQPAEIYRRGQTLRGLWGSPSCTHHSVARGGKPVNEQSRASAQCLIRWIRHKRPLYFHVENVREFRDWGPCIQKKDLRGRKIWMRVYKKGETIVEYRPDGSVKKVSVAKKDTEKETYDIPFLQQKGEPKWDYLRRLSAVGYEMSLTAEKTKKGRTFDHWVREIRKMGYDVDWKILCSADYGDPTSRKRLFVYGVSRESGMKIVWPDPTHYDAKKGVPEGYRRWRTAGDIIDKENVGESIFTRKHKLADKTLHRIAIGFIRHGLKGFIVPQNKGHTEDYTRGLDQPVSTVMCEHRGEMLITPDPYIIPQHQGQHGSPYVTGAGDPMPTLTSAGAERVVQPELYTVQMQGKSMAHGGDDPVPALTTEQKHYVVDPRFLIKLRGTGTSNSVELPLDTVSAGGDRAGIHYMVIQAFQAAIAQNGGGDRTRSINDPVPTTTTKAEHCVVSPELTELPASIIQCAHTKDDSCRVKGLDNTLGAIHASGGSYGVSQPTITQLPSSIIATAHGVDHNDESRRVKSVDETLGVVTGATDIGILTPQLVTNQEHAQNQRNHHLGNPRSDQDQSAPEADREADAPDHRAGGRRDHPAGVDGGESRADRRGESCQQADAGPAADARHDELRSQGERAGSGNAPETAAYLVPNFGERPGQEGRSHGLDRPAPAVTGHGAGGLVVPDLQPFLVPNEGVHGRNAPRSLDDQVPTATASHGAGGVVFPEAHSVHEQHQENVLGQPQDRKSGTSPDANATETSGAGGYESLHIQLLEAGAPEMARTRHYPATARSDGHPGGAAGSAAPPVDVNRGVAADSRSEIPGNVLSVVSRDGYWKVEPYIVGTAHAGDDGRLRSILDPLATVCGNRGGDGVVFPNIRPWVYTYYSSGSASADIEQPVPTSRTHDNLGVVTPGITAWNGLIQDKNGIVYPGLQIIYPDDSSQVFRLDLRFRMLTVRELARAQGFADSYEFPGTKTAAVKAIGNSVSRGVARALILTAETQKSDIRKYVYALAA